MKSPEAGGLGKVDSREKGRQRFRLIPPGLRKLLLVSLLSLTSPDHYGKFELEDRIASTGWIQNIPDLYQNEISQREVDDFFRMVDRFFNKGDREYALFELSYFAKELEKDFSLGGDSENKKEQIKKISEKIKIYFEEDEDFQRILEIEDFNDDESLVLFYEHRRFLDGYCECLTLVDPERAPEIAELMGDFYSEEREFYFDDEKISVSSDWLSTYWYTKGNCSEKKYKAKRERYQKALQEILKADPQQGPVVINALLHNFILSQLTIKNEDETQRDIKALNQRKNELFESGYSADQLEFLDEAISLLENGV